MTDSSFNNLLSTTIGSVLWSTNLLSHTINYLKQTESIPTQETMWHISLSLALLSPNIREMIAEQCANFAISKNIGLTKESFELLINTTPLMIKIAEHYIKKYNVFNLSHQEIKKTEEPFFEILNNDPNKKIDSEESISEDDSCSASDKIINEAFSNFCKRTAHVMGISGTLYLTTSEKSRVELRLESWDIFDALETLQEKLESYINTIENNQAIFKKILATLKASRQLFGIYGNQKTSCLIKKNQLVFLRSGWEGHAIGLVIYKSILAIVNRGDGGDQEFGTKFYTINNRKNITPEWTNLISTRKNQAQVNYLLSRIINLSKPFAKLPTKGQKRGTCAYVNALASIEAMICLLLSEENRELKNKAIVSETKKPRTLYKHMTTYFRDHESEIIIKYLQNNISKLEPEYQLYYTKLLSALFNEHPIAPLHSKKKHDEAVRAVWLLRDLPDKVTDNIELNENKALLFLAKKMKNLTLEEGEYDCKIRPDMSTLRLYKIRSI